MARTFQLVIFDFDGTLADSFPFFLGVFNRLADEHGFKRIDTARADEYRHGSAREMMRRVGLPAWKLPQVAKAFIALMGSEGSGITRFDGVDEVLQHLAGAGVKLAVVSSNSHDNVSRILGPVNTALITHFECGMSIFGKAARLKKALAKTGTAAREAIYIGDQITDGEAARAASVAFGAVAWGYGTIESLRGLEPDREFSAVGELERLG